MNDEFFITKTVDTGSGGTNSVRYQLYARNCDGEINDCLLYTSPSPRDA